jgi:hypothetical protein
METRCVFFAVGTEFLNIITGLSFRPWRRRQQALPKHRYFLNFDFERVITGCGSRDQRNWLVKICIQVFQVLSMLTSSLVWRVLVLTLCYVRLFYCMDHHENIVSSNELCWRSGFIPSEEAYIQVISICTEQSDLDITMWKPLCTEGSCEH